MAPTIPTIDLRMDDLDRLVDRAPRHGPLTDDERPTLKAAIDTVGYVAQLLDQKGTTLAGLRHLLLGAQTEEEPLLPPASAVIKIRAAAG